MHTRSHAHFSFVSFLRPLSSPFPPRYSFPCLSFPRSSGVAMLRAESSCRHWPAQFKNCPCAFGHETRDVDMAAMHGGDVIVAGCGGLASRVDDPLDKFSWSEGLFLTVCESAVAQFLLRPPPQFVARPPFGCSSCFAVLPFDCLLVAQTQLQTTHFQLVRTARLGHGHDNDHDTQNWQWQSSAFGRRVHRRAQAAPSPTRDLKTKNLIFMGRKLTMVC